MVAHRSVGDVRHDRGSEQERRQRQCNQVQRHAALPYPHPAVVFIAEYLIHMTAQGSRSAIRGKRSDEVAADEDRRIMAAGGAPRSERQRGDQDQQRGQPEPATKLPRSRRTNPRRGGAAGDDHARDARRTVRTGSRRRVLRRHVRVGDDDSGDDALAVLPLHVLVFVHGIEQLQRLRFNYVLGLIG